MGDTRCSSISSRAPLLYPGLSPPNICKLFTLQTSYLRYFKKESVTRALPSKHLQAFQTSCLRYVRQERVTNICKLFTFQTGCLRYVGQESVTWSLPQNICYLFKYQNKVFIFIRLSKSKRTAFVEYFPKKVVHSQLSNKHFQLQLVSLWNCRISFTGICLTCLMHNCKSESAQKCKVHCSFDLCPVQWSRNHKVRRQADWVEGMMPTAKKRRRTERPFAAVEARQSPPSPPPPPTSSATNPPINLSPMRLIHPHQLSFILYQNELNLWIEIFLWLVDWWVWKLI